MNLFWLSKKKRRNAKAHCDQHVVKIPTEAVQLLYTAWCILQPDEKWRARVPLTVSGERGYKKTQVTCGLARWVRRSSSNYSMCAEYALALCKEYTKRFGKTHAVEKHAVWLRDNLPPNLRQRPRTPIPLVTHAKSKASSLGRAVKAYRDYYCTDKISFARYRHSKPPKWLIQPAVE